MNSLLYDMAFSHCLGLGPVSYSLLLERFKTAEAAYQANRAELRDVLGEALANAFITFRERFDPVKALDRYTHKELRVINREHSLYPPMLLAISDPPICLYVKGDIVQALPASGKCIGVVGTRRPTIYGVQATNMIVDQIVREGWVIVSGLALGIDATAHTAAMNSGGKTVAFLGCGVNVIYPSANRALYERMIHEGSVVISEFPPDMTVKKGMFISRNRLISGLSKGVLVIEGSSTSGALATARYAASQGRDVMAIPAPITSTQSQAPNILLKQGAIVVTEGKDILDYYHMSQSVEVTLHEPAFGTAVEQSVYGILSSESLRADDLAQKLLIPVRQVLQALSSLEMRGVVQQSISGEYELCRSYV